MSHSSSTTTTTNATSTSVASTATTTTIVSSNDAGDNSDDDTVEYEIEVVTSSPSSPSSPASISGPLSASASNEHLDKVNCYDEISKQQQLDASSSCCLSAEDSQQQATIGSNTNATTTTSGLISSNNEEISSTKNKHYKDDDDDDDSEAPVAADPCESVCGLGNEIAKVEDCNSAISSSFEEPKQDQRDKSDECSNVATTIDPLADASEQLEFEANLAADRGLRDSAEPPSQGLDEASSTREVNGEANDDNESLAQIASSVANGSDQVETRAPIRTETTSVEQSQLELGKNEEHNKRDVVAVEGANVGTNNESDLNKQQHDQEQQNLSHETIAQAPLQPPSQPQLEPISIAEQTGKPSTSDASMPPGRVVICRTSSQSSGLAPYGSDEGCDESMKAQVADSVSIESSRTAEIDKSNGRKSDEFKINNEETTTITTTLAEAASASNDLIKTSISHQQVGSPNSPAASNYHIQEEHPIVVGKTLVRTNCKSEFVECPNGSVVLGNEAVRQAAAAVKLETLEESQEDAAIGLTKDDSDEVKDIGVKSGELEGVVNDEELEAGKTGRCNIYDSNGSVVPVDISVEPPPPSQIPQSLDARSSISITPTTANNVYRRDSMSEDLEREFDEEPEFKPREVILKRNQDARNDYELNDELGRGRFGTVYHCREHSTGRLLAAKFINLRRQEDREDVEREIGIMSKLQHKRLLQLYDAFDNCAQNEMCLITELIEGGELFERIVDDDFDLTEKKAAIFMRQICEGVEYMHSQQIVHLDMKPENILCLSKTGNRIKLIDFGLARQLDPNNPLRVMFGTPDFAAPEVLSYETVTFATDMWSIGVICYVLLTGLLPFMGDNDIQTMANVTKGEFEFDEQAFEPITDLAKDFISKLLVKDPTKRLKPRDCLQHPWLARGGAQLEAAVIERRKSSIASLSFFLTGAQQARLEQLALLASSGGSGASGSADSSQVPTGPRGSISIPVRESLALNQLNDNLSASAEAILPALFSLDKRNLKRYVIRRKWHKTVHAIMALGRMGATLRSKLVA